MFYPGDRTFTAPCSSPQICSLLQMDLFIYIFPQLNPTLSFSPCRSVGKSVCNVLSLLNYQMDYFKEDESQKTHWGKKKKSDIKYNSLYKQNGQDFKKNWFLWVLCKFWATCLLTVTHTFTASNLLVSIIFHISVKCFVGK